MLFVLYGYLQMSFYAVIRGLCINDAYSFSALACKSTATANPKFTNQEQH